MTLVIPEHLWSLEDHNKAIAHGWVFENMTTFPISATLIVDGELAIKYALAWVDPSAMGKTWKDDVITFVAENAANGVPLYEKAWTTYCYLELLGRIVDIRKTKH